MVLGVLQVECDGEGKTRGNCYSAVAMFDYSSNYIIALVIFEYIDADHKINDKILYKNLFKSRKKFVEANISTATTATVRVKLSRSTQEM